ncbi:MAG: anthranilate synthase component [Pseudomonadota bacterium]|nr:anthranilate synthase component [Pseudomonadota bacterium]
MTLESVTLESVTLESVRDKMDLNIEKLHHPLGNIIVREMPYDQLTPIMVYSAIGGVNSCMLESAYDDGYGTYSFIGINPLATFSAVGKKITVSTESAEIIQIEGDPYLLLPHFIAKRKAFGFVGYDAVRLKEHLPSRHKADKNMLPDFLFKLYKTIIKFDHKMQKLIFTHEGTDLELDKIIDKILSPLPLRCFGITAPLEISSDVTDEEFAGMVESAQEYIRSGDVFQVVLSRTFSASTRAKPLDIYRALRQLNPTPYLAFFEENDYAIVSASPELLVGVKGRAIETVPIAGTCKAGDDVSQLLACPKETAEHVMLVDLARNDIGSVATPGTVEVSRYKETKSYSHVTHIVSRVIGELSDELHPLCALKAILPAGTLSGAPKIRAMQIIDELECSQRGLYGGAIMLIDENGDITSSIAIRSAVICDNVVEIRTGAGIVFDSIPEKEVMETKLKARGVIAALELAHGGLQ